jgi:hypothetical protein
MPEVRLDAADGAELAEMLQFLSQWLAHDPAAWPLPWKSWWATPAYGIQDLRSDLERLVFLLAEATASPSSTHDCDPGQPGLRRAWRASTSFVLALRAAGAAR